MGCFSPNNSFLFPFYPPLHFPFCTSFPLSSLLLLLGVSVLITSPDVHDQWRITSVLSTRVDPFNYKHQKADALAHIHNCRRPYSIQKGEMGSLTAAAGSTGRRSSSRRGSRSSEYQQQQLNQTANHNNRDNNCQISASSGSVSPYVSVAVRVLESGSSSIFGFRDACSWCREIWHWIEATVERHCPPRWTPWILAGGSLMVGCFLAISWILMDVVWIYSQLCSLTVPFFALMSGYLLLALGFRHSWTPTGIYLTFCGSIIGETVGFFLSSALDAQVLLRSSIHLRTNGDQTRFIPLFFFILFALVYKCIGSTNNLNL